MSLRQTKTSFAHPGKYSGTIRSVSKYTAGDISATTVVRVAVRIEPNGRFIALPRGVVGFAPVSGVVQDNGTINLENGDDIPVTVAGSRITFGSESAIAKLGATITGTETWTLRRVGR